MNPIRELSPCKLPGLLLPVLVVILAIPAKAHDLRTESQVISPPIRHFGHRLGSDTSGRFVVFVGGSSIVAQRIDEFGTPVGDLVLIAEGDWSQVPKVDVSDGWGIAYQIFERTGTTDGRVRIFVRETLEGPAKELAVGYEGFNKSSFVYRYPLVGWLQYESSAISPSTLASVNLTAGTTVARESLPSNFQTNGNSVNQLRIADFAVVVRRYNASSGYQEIWIRSLLSLEWVQISEPGSHTSAYVVTGGPWIAWFEYASGPSATDRIRAYNHLTHDYRLVATPSDGASVWGPYSATQEYLTHSSTSPNESYLYSFEDGTNHLVAEQVQDISLNSATILGDMVVFRDPRVSELTLVRFAECIDDDGDGVCLPEDVCPTENATGFDANLDGCIDSIDGMAEFLATLVNEGLIDATLQNSLLSKVKTATASVDRDSVCAAINEFSALKNQIVAQTGKKISPDAADLVIAYIDNVITIQLAALPPGSTCP